MKRLLAALAALLLPMAASASPTLACDADQRATHSAVQFCSTVNTSTTPASCTIWGAWGADVPVIAGTPFDTCNHDLASVPVGLNIVRVKAIDAASLWTGGREESAPSAPFVFTRPPGMGAVTGIRITP